MERSHTNFGLLSLVMALLLAACACGGSKQARVNVPPPPAITAPTTQNPSATETADTPSIAPASEVPAKPKKRPPTDEDSSGQDTDTANAEPSIPADAPIISSEAGLASWYGPPYNHRRASNGEIYDMNAMTAAHKTLPLGSIVRVTNTKNDESVVVRITDRGPFIPGRVVDLSLAAAKKIDLWRAGVAPVRVEVLQTPAPLETGGKWAVQIGGFQDEDEASNLVDRLTRRYHTAKVQSFSSPAGDWWVRVRVLNDDHTRAAQLAAETTTTQGAVFLVRLD